MANRLYWAKVPSLDPSDWGGDWTKFTVPENSNRENCLFEIRRKGKKISFFCPERHKNLKSEVWYSYVELFDENSRVHELPGQVRVDTNDPCIRLMGGKPRFIEVLENITLNTSAVTA